MYTKFIYSSESFWEIAESNNTYSHVPHLRLRVAEGDNIKFKKLKFLNFSKKLSDLNLIAKKLFKSASLSILILGFFLLPKISLAANITPENIIALTNQERKDAGLSVLKANQLLAKAAHDKGLAILESQIFQHTIEGRKFSAWISESGYFYAYAGENLAINFTTAEGVFKAWENSPTHYKNILNPLFKEIGVAVVAGEFNGKNTLIVAQAFGAPPDMASAPVVAGQSAASGFDYSAANSDQASFFYPQPLESLNSLARSAINNSRFYSGQNVKLTFSGLKPLSVLAAGAAGDYSVKAIKNLSSDTNNSILSFILILFSLALVFMSILTVAWLYLKNLLTLIKLNTGWSFKI